MPQRRNITTRSERAWSCAYLDFMTKSIVVFLFFALVFSLGTRRSLAFSGDWLDAGEQKKPRNILSRLINNDLLRFDYSSSSERIDSSNNLLGLEKDQIIEEEVALNPLGNAKNNIALASYYDKKNIGGSVLYAPVSQPSSEPIRVMAQYGWKGLSDEYGDVYVLYGDSRVEVSNSSVSAPKAVVWIREKSNDSDPLNVTKESSVWVYLEDEGDSPLILNLSDDCTFAKSDGHTWLGCFKTTSEVELHIALPGESQLNPDEMYSSALQQVKWANERTVSGDLFQPASVESFGDETSSRPLPAKEVDQEGGAKEEETVLGWNLKGDGDVVRTIPKTVSVSELKKSVPDLQNASLAFRRIKISPRYDNDYDVNIESESNGKNVVFISKGFTLVVQGESENLESIGDALELSADQATFWVGDIGTSNVSSMTIDHDVDFEIYLEGNVVFRLGDNVVYANRIYYDVKNSVGVLENAEMYAHMPGEEKAALRLGAEKIVQRGANSLIAEKGWVTTSMMGAPTYRLQSDSLTAETRRLYLTDVATGEPAINSTTGKPQALDKTYLIAENNFVSVGSIPVLYWPWMASEIQADRSLYLRSLKMGHDGALGTEVLTSWNLYQLLGISDKRPEGSNWDLNLDYLSRRGFGHGTTFDYQVDSLFGLDTRAVGVLNFYGISDNGLDNLGYGRRALGFEHDYRYRAIWKHRQELGSINTGLGLLDDCSLRDGWTLTGQLAKSSDSNFLPQYFEEEWNTSSDPVTQFELKRTVNNRSLGIMGSVRTDSFYTQTNWLPRLDHYWLGQALGSSPFVWYEHTRIGYAQFKTADSPYDPADQALFRYLNWELDPSSVGNEVGNATTLERDSFVFSTRQEIDLPLQIGPVKTTPYALGEYGFWGNGVDSESVSRLYGQLGVRFNLPVWKVNSEIESKTWYLNGLAHKMNFIADVSYTDSNKDYDDLVLYDQMDDLQVEDYRRRYSVTTYGQGAGFSDSIPLRFDERYYSIRQGILAGSVTSPVTEAVDDLTLVRLGWNNRWQTKRGPIDSRRVVDWITFNVGVNLYPNKEENFGEVPGFIDYDATWQVGDRFSVLSSGLYDVWGTGQKITRIGVQRRRPGLSSCYLGIDRLDGPIDSTYLNFGLTYRTSEKWGLGFSNSYDLSEGYNIGQKATISRIGESLIFTLGASRNESKDNWGVSLSVEPVFMYDSVKKSDGILDLGRM